MSGRTFRPLTAAASFVLALAVSLQLGGCELANGEEADGQSLGTAPHPHHGDCAGTCCGTSCPCSGPTLSLWVNTSAGFVVQWRGRELAELDEGGGVIDVCLDRNGFLFEVVTSAHADFIAEFEDGTPAVLKYVTENGEGFQGSDITIPEGGTTTVILP